ncbi:myb-related transcription factor, partner of profilin isoform 1-T2 [Rhinophrynus dorsalis]
MSGDTEEVTRLRKPRFSYEENQILIEEVRTHYSMLYGVQSQRLSVSERKLVWEGIAAKINAITSWKRTAQEVQKRWNDFKRRTKEKLARVPHSTQCITSEEALSAEEETLFAILGPGVVPGRRHYDSGTLLRNMDYYAMGTGSSSPETSLGAPNDSSLLLHSKDSPSPASQLHIVQLRHLNNSPDPSEGGSPPPPGAGTPLLSPSEVAPNYDPAVAMLRAQHETAEAIRHLTYTLRQSMDRLTNVLAAILPLVPGQVPTSPAPSGLLDPVYYPTKAEQEVDPDCPVAYDEDGAQGLEGEAGGEGEVDGEIRDGEIQDAETQDGEIRDGDIQDGDIQDAVEDPPLSPSPPPPNKRKRFGYMTHGKRKGRWKNY